MKKNPFHCEPFYCYVFRRWFKEPGDDIGTQAEVVVVRSSRQLYPDEMLARLQDAAGDRAKEYVYVEVEPESTAVLDTWEEAIESVFPGDARAPYGCRAFAEWWTGDFKLLRELTPVDEE
ncbi:MAG TPA: hypothetical protein PKA88_18025 [Polyangiaceae bacterium]|nr:hypothetical protein [Polyangiaceae bacterium]HMR81113.1 hypothetical protein [Polyangiaceae bacterium]